MKRKKIINKRRAARKFNKGVSRVKRVNVRPKPMRGGGRL